MNKLCCVLNIWAKCSECDWFMCHSCLPKGTVAWYQHKAQSPKCSLNVLGLHQLNSYVSPGDVGVNVFIRRKK